MLQISSKLQEKLHIYVESYIVSGYCLVISTEQKDLLQNLNITPVFYNLSYDI